MDLYEGMAKNLVSVRMRLGYTAEQFAARLGLSIDHYMRFENGGCRDSEWTETIIPPLTLAGVSIDYLVEGKGPMMRPGR